MNNKAITVPLAMFTLLVMCLFAGCQTLETGAPDRAEMPEFIPAEPPLDKALVYVYNARYGLRDANVYICYARPLEHGQWPGDEDHYLMIDSLEVPVPKMSPRTRQRALYIPNRANAIRFYDLHALREGLEYNLFDSVIDGTLSGSIFYHTVDEDALAADLSTAQEHPEIQSKSVHIVPHPLAWRTYYVLELKPGPIEFWVGRERGEPRGRRPVPWAVGTHGRVQQIDLEPGQRYFVKYTSDPHRFRQVTEQEAMTPNSFLQIRPLGILDCRLIADNDSSTRHMETDGQP